MGGCRFYGLSVLDSSVQWEWRRRPEVEMPEEMYEKLIRAPEV
jgi:hypothetical protein